MMNYNRRNGNKCFYIGGSMIKGVRRVRRMRVGHYETGCSDSDCVGHYETGCSDSDCVGLFDFVMAHYIDDIALMRLNLWNDTGV